jgi:hypothetical protein
MGLLGLVLGVAWAGDKDGDGVSNKVDTCREDKEDIDEFEDDDGCPDPDNDNDGIEDEQDKCRDQAEDLDDFADDDGCPDPDNDNDGVLDPDDRCAEEKEDSADRDGCATVSLQLLTETGWMAAVGQLGNELLSAAGAENPCPQAAEAANAWFSRYDPGALEAEWKERLERADPAFDRAGATALLAGKGEVYRSLAPALELLCKEDTRWSPIAPRVSAVYSALPVPPPAPKKRRGR